MANFGDIKLRSEGGLEWTLDSSIRLIPADEVSNILSIENGATHLKHRVRAFLAPAHMAVAFHAVEELISWEWIQVGGVPPKL